MDPYFGVTFLTGQQNAPTFSTYRQSHIIGLVINCLSFGTPFLSFFVTPQLIHTDTEYIMLEQRFDKAKWSMEKRKTMISSRMEQKSTPMLRRGLQMSSSSSTSTTTSSFLIDDILVQRPKVVLVQWKAAQVNITTFEVEFKRKNRSVGKLSKPLMQILRTSFPSYTIYPISLYPAQAPK